MTTIEWIERLKAERKRAGRLSRNLYQTATMGDARSVQREALMRLAADADHLERNIDAHLRHWWEFQLFAEQLKKPPEPE